MVTLPVIGQFGPEVLLNYKFLGGNSCTSGPESLLFRVMLQSKCKLNFIVVRTDSSRLFCGALQMKSVVQTLK